MLKYFASRDKVIEEPRLIFKKKKNLSLHTHSFTHTHIQSIQYPPSLKSYSSSFSIFMFYISYIEQIDIFLFVLFKISFLHTECIHMLS